MASSTAFSGRCARVIAEGAVLTVMLIVATARADTHYWVAGAGTGFWSDATKWDTTPGGPGGDGAPHANDDVQFTSSDASNRTISYNVDMALGSDLASLTINGSGTGNPELRITAYSFRLGVGTETIGSTGRGYVTQSTGTHAISSSLFLGRYSGSSGYYMLSGGTLTAANEYLGWNGNAQFMQNGGTHTANYVYMAYNYRSSATYTIGAISPGTFAANYLTLGGADSSSGGSATLGIFSGSQVSVNSRLRLWGTSTVSLNSGGSLMVNTFDRLGGAFNMDAAATLGVNSLSGFGATPSFAGTVQFGILGSTTSAHTVGAGQTFTVKNLAVGENATSTFAVSGGGRLTVNGYSDIGHWAGSHGTVNVSGTGSMWSNDAGSICVGTYGAGALSIGAGGVVSDVDAWAGAYTGSSGTVSIDGAGSRWTTTGKLWLGGTAPGAGGTASMNLTNGGTCVVQGEMNVLAGGTVTINGGTLQVVNPAVPDVAPMTVSGGLIDLKAGAFTHDGEVTLTAGGRIRCGDWSTSRITINGGGSLVSTGALTIDGVDVSGVGSLLQADHLIGDGTPGNSPRIRDAASGICNNYTLIWDGHLRLETGGTLTVAGETGATGGGDPRMYVSGTGSALTTGSLYICGTSAGPTSWSDGIEISSGGTVTVGQKLKLWSAGSGSAAMSFVTLNSGGTLIANEIEREAVTTFAANAGSTLRVNSLSGFGNAISFGGAVQFGHTGSTTSAHMVGAGQTFAVGGALDIGYNAASTLTISGGGVLTSSTTADLGRAAGSSGMVNISGASSAWNSTSSICVGNGGVGTINISGGAKVTSGTGSTTGGYIGLTPSAAGSSVTVTGSGSEWALPTSNLNVGGSYSSPGGTATLLLTASGKCTVGTGLRVWAPGTITIDGGTLATYGDIDVNGGLIDRKSGSWSWSAGKTATISNGGRIRTLSQGLQGGTTVNISSGGSWVSNGYLDMASTSGTTTVTVAGLGSSLQTSSESYWGANGSALVTFADEGYGLLGAVRVGTGGSGSSAITVEDGAEVTQSGNLYLGYATAATGSLTVGGLGRWTGTNVYVGGTSTAATGTGNLTIGVLGIVDVDKLQLWTRGTATLNGFLFADEIQRSGGTLNTVAGSEIYTNRFTGFGDTIASSGSIFFGIGGPIACDVTVGAGQTIQAGEGLNVGAYGPASLLVQNGGLLTSATGSVGSDTNTDLASATVTGGGSRWNLSSDISVGCGSLSVRDGATVNAAGWGFFTGYEDRPAYVAVGNEAGAGVAASLSVARSLYIGRNKPSSTTLDIQSGGSVLVGQVCYVEPYGTLHILNGGLLQADTVTRNGTALLTDAGSTLRVNHLTGFGNTLGFAGNLHLGVNVGSAAGSLSLGAGQSLTTGEAHELIVGYDAPATLVLSGGGNATGGTVYIGRYAGAGGSISVDAIGSWLRATHGLALGGSSSADGGFGSLAVTGESSRVYVGGINAADADACIGMVVPGLIASDIDPSRAALTIRHGSVVAADRLYLGMLSGQAGAATITGVGSYLAADVAYVGLHGSGTLSVTDAATLIGRYIAIAPAPGSTGAASVSGAGAILRATQRLVVGGDPGMPGGAGTLNVGNRVCVGDIDPAAVEALLGSAFSGTLVVSDSDGVGGQMSVCNGSTVSAPYAYIGLLPGHSGALTLSGAGAAFSGTTLHVGRNSVGTVTLQSGALALHEFVQIGEVGGSGTAMVKDPGSTWNCSNEMFVGIGGTGSLRVESGGRVSAPWMLIGYSGALGAVSVTGAGASLDCPEFLSVGTWTAGTLTVQDGGVVSSDTGELATAASSTGSATITGAGSRWSTRFLFVGTSGPGTLDVNAGGVVSSISGHLGATQLGAGQVSISGAGSAWNNSGSLLMGGTESVAGGIGTISVNDFGLLNVGGKLTIGTGSTVSVNANATAVADEIDRTVGSFNTQALSTVRVNKLTGFGTAVNFAGNLQFGHAGGATAAAYAVGAGQTLCVGGALDVGYDAAATLSVADGGSLTVTGASTIGRYPGASGAATVSSSTLPGSAWRAAGGLQLGGTGSVDGGVGTLNLTGAGSRVYVGDVDPATIESRLLPTTTALVISDRDGLGGSLVVRHGSTLSGQDGSIAFNAGESGSASIRGAGSAWTIGRYLDVGYGGQGSLDVSAGGVVTSLYGYVGTYAGSVGHATVSDAGSRLSSPTFLVVGSAGSGTLEVRDGGAVSTSNCHVGYSPGSNGTLAVSGAGSSFISTGPLRIGTNGAGTLDISVGGAAEAARIEVGSGVLGAGVVTLSGAGSLLSSSSSIAIGGSASGAGGCGAVSIRDGARLQASDGITVHATPGTYLELQQATIAAPTVLVNGILRGSGTIDAILVNAGRISPGLSAGEIAITGNFTQDAAGRLVTEIGGVAPGTQYDRLQVAQQASLAGALDLQLTGGFAPSPTDAFAILSYASRIGRFDTVMGSHIAPGQSFSFNYGETSLSAIAGQWNNPQFTGVLEVPESLAVTGTLSTSEPNATLLKVGPGGMTVSASSAGLQPGFKLAVGSTGEAGGTVDLTSDLGPNAALRINNGAANAWANQHLAELGSDASVNGTYSTATGTTTVSAALALGQGATFTKRGAGALRITGPAPSSGGTGPGPELRIQSGTLIVGDDAALGSATHLVLGGGSGGAGVAFLVEGSHTLNNPITIAAGDTGNVVLGPSDAGAVATFAGSLALAHDLIIRGAPGATVAVAGPLDNSEGRNLRFEGGGTLTFSGPTMHGAGATLVIDGPPGAAVKLIAPAIPQANTILAANDVTLQVQDGTAPGAISPATLNSIWTLVRSGYNGTGGSWTGTGITTTAVSTSSLNGLGLVLTGDPALEAQTLTVREMILGDVNGDNKVTIGDVMVALNSANYQQDGTWLNGDVNYDGKVTIGDVMLMLNSTRYQQDYNPANAPAQIAAMEAAGLGYMADAAVPEPAAFGVLLAGAMSLLIRRRRS